VKKDLRIGSNFQKQNFTYLNEKALFKKNVRSFNLFRNKFYGSEENQMVEFKQTEKDLNEIKIEELTKNYNGAIAEATKFKLLYEEESNKDILAVRLAESEKQILESIAKPHPQRQTSRDASCVGDTKKKRLLMTLEMLLKTSKTLQNRNDD
jgi:hypothetical protein